MDNGNYNDGGFRPCNYSSYERAYLGWLTPEELKNDGKMTLEPLQTQPKAYLIRNEAWAEESYLVEFRQQQGWDLMLPGSGIVVFHVDYDENEFMWGWVNSDRRKRFTIFPANDNDDERKNWAYPYNGNNSLTNTSQPAAELNNLNIDSTFLMSKPITEMTVTEGVASFSFHNDIPTSVPYIPQQSLRKDDEWYRIGDRMYIHQGKVVWVR